MALLSADSFNRANGAVGSTDGAGSLDPLAWTANAGTWAISSNQLNASVLGAGPSVAVITCNLATANVDLSLTHGPNDVNGWGIVCRFSDMSNYVYLLGSSTTMLQLTKVVAGSSSAISGSFNVVNVGDVLRLVAVGNSFFVYHNGVLQGSSPYTDSFNNTATKHGIAHQGTSQLSDAWSVNSAGITTVTGSQATETDTATSGTLFAVRAGVIQFIPAVTTA